MLGIRNGNLYRAGLWQDYFNNRDAKFKQRDDLRGVILQQYVLVIDMDE
jgi:hypothetical protein